MTIEVLNVSKSAGGKQVLKDVNWKISSDDTWLLTGPEDSGKTLMLRILLGLEKPDSGSVNLLGDYKYASVNAGVVFQEDRLCPGVSPVENVLLVTGKEKEAEARSLLTELGLGDSLDLPCAELSGGMRRRAAIARAILAEGELLTLDEPFKGLDEQNRRAAAALVLRHRRGRTLLYVTHEREEAALLGGEILQIP